GARAAGMPSVDLFASETFQGPTKAGFTRSRQFEGGADLTAPIDVSGRVRAGRRVASHAEREALARVGAEAQRLVPDVTEAYLDVLQARRETLLVGELRELDEERLRVAQVKAAAGVALPLEVSQTEADLAEAVQREIETVAQVRQAGATLNILIGRPAAAPLS